MRESKKSNNDEVKKIHISNYQTKTTVNKDKARFGTFCCHLIYTGLE